MKLSIAAFAIAQTMANTTFTTESDKASGTIYVVRHAEAGGGKGLSDTGFEHAKYWPTVFDGSKFQAPATIIAGLLKSTTAEQRMYDTVKPTGDALGITIDTVRPIEKENSASEAAAQAFASLDKGPVLIAWWSDLESYMCKDLGLDHKCRDFKGYDEVLVVDVQDGKASSLTYTTGGFKKDATRRRVPTPTPPMPPTRRRVPTPTPSPSGADTLPASGTLQSGGRLVSAGGRSHLSMQKTGNLVMYQDDVAVWSTGTKTYPGAYLLLQESGPKLVLLQAVDQAIVWSSDVVAGATKLVVLDDDLVFSDDAGNTLASVLKMGLDEVV